MAVGGGGGNKLHSGFGGMAWGSFAWGGIVLQSSAPQTNETTINGQVRIEITPDTSVNGQVRVITTVPEKLPQTWTKPTATEPQTWHYDNPEKETQMWTKTDKTAPSDWVDSSDSTKQPETWKSDNNNSTKKQPQDWHYEQCIDGTGGGE